MTAVVSAEAARRLSWRRVTAIAALTFVSILVVIHHIGLSRIHRQIEDADSTARLGSVDERLATLMQQVERQQGQPPAVLQTRYENEQALLVDRLSALDRSLAEQHTTLREHAQDVDRRVTQLTSRMASIARPSPPRRSPPTTAVSTPNRPPFQLVGIEQRADEHFVSVLPEGAATLAQLRLLRPGDTHAGWRLDSIAADHAVFRHSDGQTSVPIRTRAGDAP